MFSRVFVAGTFDKLHMGHEVLLLRAFTEGRMVTIGLTSDNFIAMYKSGGTVAPFAERKQQLVAWLTKKQLLKKAYIIAIDDPFEPAVSTTDYQALVVSNETKGKGIEINSMRQMKGFPAVELIEVTMVNAEDGMPISSTRLRNGEIHANGQLVMPDTLRKVLAKPLGTLLPGRREIHRAIDLHRRHIAITVGDMATFTLLTERRLPALIIIDHKVERKAYHDLDAFLESSGADIKKMTSGPGFIAHTVMNEIRSWGREILRTIIKQRILIIDGEEDLLTLPVLAYAPLGSFVYYGQPARIASQNDAGGPGEGLVEVEITQTKKEEAIALLSKFT